MHPIASRFSPEARQAVVDIFSDENRISSSPYGLVVPYNGQLVCPLGIALIVDGKDCDNYGFTYYVPPSEEVASALTDDPAEQKTIRNEASGFLLGQLSKRYSREYVLEAFGG